MRSAALLLSLVALVAVPANRPAGPPASTSSGSSLRSTSMAGAIPPGSGGPPITVTAGLREPPPAGGFVLPLAPPPVVLTEFRPPEHRYGTGHRGVDLAAPAGTTVRAAGAGTVVYAGMVAGRGVVSIEHAGGVRTTYEPVLASVDSGQQVDAGDPIGTLSPGHPSCAPRDCLHWGVRLPDGSYLDPMALLRPWRVRLKPWDAR